MLHVRVQRLTRSLPGMQREAILSSYISSDLLGCVGEEGSQHVEALLTLMKSPDPTVREQLTRLFNTFSSLSHGRSYLSESPPMTKALLDMLYSERRKDTATRRNALGAIQKLSLRYVWGQYVNSTLGMRNALGPIQKLSLSYVWETQP